MPLSSVQSCLFACACVCCEVGGVCFGGLWAGDVGEVMGVAIAILNIHTGTIKGHSKWSIQLEEYLAVPMSLHLASRHQRTVSETSSWPREKTERWRMLFHLFSSIKEPIM